MPRQYLMTWEPIPRRWKKIYRGKQYVVSCRQLSAPETKQDSYRAANEWSRARKSTISPALPHGEPEVLAELTRRRDWARANDRAHEAAEYQRRIDISNSTDDPGSLLLPPDVERRLAGLKVLGITIPDEIDPHTLQAVLGEARIWDERSRRDQEPVPDDRTVGFQIAEYQKFQLARAQHGQVSVSDYDQTCQALKEFRIWIGAETVVDAIETLTKLGGSARQLLSPRVTDLDPEPCHGQALVA